MTKTPKNPESWAQFWRRFDTATGARGFENDCLVGVSRNPSELLDGLNKVRGIEHHKFADRHYHVGSLFVALRAYALTDKKDY